MLFTDLNQLFRTRLFMVKTTESANKTLPIVLFTAITANFLNYHYGDCRFLCGREPWPSSAREMVESSVTAEIHLRKLGFGRLVGKAPTDPAPKFSSDR